MAKSPKIVVSARADGLGARLLAMLNAINIAEKLGVEFKFSWPVLRADDGFHAVPPAEEMFSEAFLRAHYEPHIIRSQYCIIHEKDPVQAIIDAELADKSSRGFYVMTCDRVANVGDLKSDPAAVHLLWKKIEFSPRLQKVVEAAETVTPPSSVAFHIRRGDTVSGDYRLRLFNAKFMPLAYIKTALSDLSAKGENIIMFGDDPKIISMMADRVGVKTTRDMGCSSFQGRDEQALFDMVVMANCSRILATRSVFTIIASLIGDIPRADPVEAFYNMLSSDGDFAAARREGKRLILSDIAENPHDYPRLDLAKEYQWIGDKLSDTVTKVERDGLFRKAAELDPENYTYTHIRASLKHRWGRDAEADDHLRDAAEGYFASKDGAVSDIVPAFHLMGEKIDATWDPPALTGCYPYISLFVAQNTARLGGAVSCLPIAKRAHLLKPHSEVILAFYAQQLIDSDRDWEAELVLKDAIAEGRRAAIFYRLLTDTADKARDKKQALINSEEAFSLAPSNVFIRTRYSLFLSRSGREKKAIELMKDVSLDDLNDAQTSYSFSRLMGRLGEKQRAKVSAEKALSLRPNKAHYKKWLDSLG